jgi:hypothetical protein
VSSEIEIFRANLRAAGQPWSRRGIVCVVVGIVLLGAAQFVGQAAPFVEFFFPLLVGSAIMIAIGWVMLIVAVVRRQRWAKTHDLTMPSLSGAGEGRR